MSMPKEVGRSKRMQEVSEADSDRSVLTPFCWPDLLAVSLCSMNGLNHEAKTLGNMELRWSGRNISMLHSFERYCCAQASEPAEEGPSLQVLALARPCWHFWCLFSNLVAFASARGQALSGSKACATMQCSKRFLSGNRSRPYVPCDSGDDGPSCVDHFSPLEFCAGGQPLSNRHLEPKRVAGKIGQTN